MFICKITRSVRSLAPLVFVLIAGAVFAGPLAPSAGPASGSTAAASTRTTDPSANFTF